MGLESTPKQPSPEEMAKIEKERALSDAELLKDGAEYKFDEEGSKTLEVTDKQIEETKEEMKKEQRPNKNEVKDDITQMSHVELDSTYKELWKELEQESNKGARGLRFWENITKPINYEKLKTLRHKMGEIMYENQRRHNEITDAEQRLAKVRLTSGKKNRIGTGPTAFGYTESEILRKEKNEMNIKSIDDVQSFDELYELIRKIDVLEDKGANNFFHPTEVIDIIEKIRIGEDKLDNTPQIGNLPSKVAKLLEKKEEQTEPSPDTSPEILPGIKYIPTEEWKDFINKEGSSHAIYPDAIIEYLPHGWGFPEIGAEGLGTKYGEINGPMVYCDGVFAILDTPQGYLKVPFLELISSDGYHTYREILEEAEEEEKEAEEEEERKRLYDDRDNLKEQSL